ncbi:uncharacterized protein LOC143484977 isoform X2 [Brachyhypopomus gauderio]|uniref:uncharacterized protein LOC143484977 isoform X2 n=1 Tax=Brachyhypopomus gauderio TaxID=698409 RepID=UPI0040414D61
MDCRKVQKSYGNWRDDVMELYKILESAPQRRKTLPPIQQKESSESDCSRRASTKLEMMEAEQLKLQVQAAGTRAIGNRAAPTAAGAGRELQPKPPSKPAVGKAGLKTTLIRQRAATSYKPAEKRDTARTAGTSQGKGAVAETLSLEQEHRVQKLVEKSLLQEERQEAIFKRICGKSSKQSTRSNNRVNAKIRLEPLGNGQNGSLHSDASSVSHCPPLDKPQRVRSIQGPQAAASEDLSPLELRANYALQMPKPQNRAKLVKKAGKVPVSSKDSSVSLKPLASKLPVGSQVNQRQGSVACCEAIRNWATPNAAGSIRELQPKPPSKPAVGKPGLKASRISQRAVTSFRPVEKRDTARAASISQDKGVVPGTLSLVREKLLAKPELGLSQAFQLLENEDWKKIIGLTLVRSLAQNHAEVLLANLHDVCIAVIKEVKNSDDTVSRAAMTTLAHMFAYLRTAMDPEAAQAACVLLHKAVENRPFIREDVHLVLRAMVHCCSARTVMHALLDGGLRCSCDYVRRTTALHLQSFAQLVGASKLLTDEDLTESFLTAISRLALDDAEEVRCYAHKCIQFLAIHEDFVKLVAKFLPPEERSSIKDIMKSRSIDCQQYKISYRLSSNMPIFK